MSGGFRFDLVSKRKNPSHGDPKVEKGQQSILAFFDDFDSLASKNSRKIIGQDGNGGTRFLRQFANKGDCNTFFF